MYSYFTFVIEKEKVFDSMGPAGDFYRKTPEYYLNRLDEYKQKWDDLMNKEY